MKAWAHAHVAALGLAWRSVRLHPLASLASLLALASAIALPLAAVAVLSAVREMASGFDTDPQLSLVLANGLGTRERDALERAVRGRPGVSAVRLITREQALAELQATEGVRDVLAGLPGNPLPDVLAVRVGDRRRTAALRDELARMPGVAGVQADAAWVERLDALLAAGRVVAVALALLLGSAVLAITFNTVRLQIAARSEELAVAALVGATRSWQRRPFLYFGALQGAVAGLAASGAIGLLLWLVARELAPFAVASAARWAVSAEQALTTILLSATLGWIGARLAIGRKQQLT